KVYEPPPVPENSPVLMLMATHWKRVPLNIFRVLRSWSVIWQMSSPCFRPVMRHTPAIAASLASIRFHDALLPERLAVSAPLATLMSNELFVPTHVSLDRSSAAFSVSYCHVTLNLPFCAVYVPPLVDMNFLFFKSNTLCDK